MDAVKRKILVCAGTRPEAIKLAPLVMRLRERPDEFETVLCSTGQHREMIAQAFSDFGLSPGRDLGVMTPGQTLASLTARLITALDALLESERPDALIVQGDTTTVMAASLCAFYRGVTVGHVEAGLRSFDRRAPFPEEVNRRVAGITADLHFCPTEAARENLLREGAAPDSVFVTGNTVVDALLHTVRAVRADPRPLPPEVEAAFAGGRRVVLVTGHRRESFGEGLRSICQAIAQLCREHPDVRFVYPVHLNPNVHGPVSALLGDCPGVTLTAPMAYKDFVRLMDRCHLILTDSGGIQEEAPTLGKPVLVMREVTERPEAVRAGAARLVGADAAAIVRETGRLLTGAALHAAMAGVPNPFGDGRASERIADILARRLSGC